jgi:putative Ca2+/H+ antiporter (TMEM165/GDT1 family)
VSELTGSSFGYVVLLSYWTVLLAELVGDKSIYSITSLSLRYRAGVVFTGITVAFACKMLVAVLLVRLLVRLHFWTDLASAIAFFVLAVFLWIQEPEPEKHVEPAAAGWWKGVVVCFAALFLTEWGDPSQVAVAALSVKSHSLVAPWLGGTLAMATKGGLAMTVGVKLRERVSQKVLRTVATASFVVLGLLALRGLVVR